MYQYMTSTYGAFTKWPATTIESVDPNTGQSWYSTPECEVADVATQSRPARSLSPIRFFNKAVWSNHGTSY